MTVPEVLVEIGDGLRVHYHEAGEGPVVLFHGSGPGASGWSNFRQSSGVRAAASASSSPTRSAGHLGMPDGVEYTPDFLEGAGERFSLLVGVGRCGGGQPAMAGPGLDPGRLRRPELVQKPVLMVPGGLEEREVYMKMEGILLDGRKASPRSGRHHARLDASPSRSSFSDTSLVDAELLDERHRSRRARPRRGSRACRSRTRRLEPRASPVPCLRQRHPCLPDERAATPIRACAGHARRTALRVRPLGDGREAAFFNDVRTRPSWRAE